MIIKVVVNEDNDFTGEHLEFYAQVTAIKPDYDNVTYKLGLVPDLIIHESDYEVVGDSFSVSVSKYDGGYTKINLTGECTEVDYKKRTDPLWINLPVAEISFMEKFPVELCQAVESDYRDRVLVLD